MCKPFGHGSAKAKRNAPTDLIELVRYAYRLTHPTGLTRLKLCKFVVGTLVLPRSIE